MKVTTEKEDWSNSIYEFKIDENEGGRVIASWAWWWLILKDIQYKSINIERIEKWSPLRIGAWLTSPIKNIEVNRIQTTWWE